MSVVKDDLSGEELTIVLKATSVLRRRVLAILTFLATLSASIFSTSPSASAAVCGARLRQLRPRRSRSYVG